ncbi:uncharacterized protein JCM15063_006032 [Sporobolomyces koalae]|uniref:uncharacterized protein n=1 Tax=Sporobolomyces koalae TaxID=500713 RepID=UPI003173A5C4
MAMAMEDPTRLAPLPMALGELVDTEPTDADTLNFIAFLLTEEIANAIDHEVAEQLQLDWLSQDESDFQDPNKEQVCHDSASAYSETDAIVAMRLHLDEINSILSQEVISAMTKEQTALAADSIRSKQLALTLEAKDRRQTLDHAMAQKLQTILDQSDDNSQDRQDLDAESILGHDRVQRLMQDPHAILEDQKVDKGKARAQEQESPPSAPHISAACPEELPTCQICFDPCRIVFDPAGQAARAGTSDSICLGMYLGDRVDRHIGCLDCLKTFIENKLNDLSRKTFPIACFQCAYILSDEDATRILGKDGLEQWPSSVPIESAQLDWSAMRRMKTLKPVAPPVTQ